jgi:hypothetical protein
MPDSGLPACAVEINTAAGGKLTDDEIMEIAERIQKERTKLAKVGQIDKLDQRLAEIAKQEGEKAKLAAALQRKQAALTIIARDRSSAHVRGLMAQGVKAHKAVLAMFEGITNGIRDARRSVYATKLAFEGRFIGDMMAEVQRTAPHTIGLMRDKEFADDVVREMFELREGGKPGLTGNADAKTIARIFAKHAEISRVDMNSLGANIGKLDDWGGPHSHDSYKLMRVTDDEWVAKIMPRLNLERSFEGLTEDEIRKVLKESYLTITTGKSNKLTAARKGEFQGPRNLANSLGRDRVFHFKSADDWLAYNEEFGMGNIITGMMNHQRRAAALAAQMQMFGPSPEVMLGSLLDELQMQVKRDPKLSAKQKNKQIAALNLQGTQIEQAMREAAGITMSASREHMGYARFWSGYRATQSMAKLGGAVISSVSDTVTQAANMKYQGKSLLGSYHDQIVGMLNSIGRTGGDAKAREIAYLMGEGFDGLIDNIHASTFSHDGVPGAMTNAMSTFFRWSGLTWWTDSMRAVGARMMSAHMGKRVGTAWKSLDDQYRFVLGQHGIDEARWEVIRQAKFMSDDGKVYVTPDRIGEIPDQAFTTLIDGEVKPAKIKRAKLDLELAVRAFFADEINFGMIETDARSRRFTLRGTQGGTVVGEILRMMSQFKGWPIAFTQRVLGRAAFGQRNAASFSTAGHIGHLMAGLTIAGYLAMTAKDYLRGYDRRKFFEDDGSLNLKTLQAAFLQGGGAGIYGDFLFGQTNRFGGGLAETTIGPGFGAAFDLGELVLKARDGDAKAADGLNYILQNTPYVNLSYARPIADFLFLNALRESMSPGFLQRQHSKRRKEYGQERLYPQTVQ